MLVRNGLQLRMSVWSTILGVALNGVAQFGDAALQLEHRRRGPTPVEPPHPRRRRSLCSPIAAADHAAAPPSSVSRHDHRAGVAPRLEGEGSPARGPSWFETRRSAHRSMTTQRMGAATLLTMRARARCDRNMVWLLGGRRDRIRRAARLSRAGLWGPVPVSIREHTGLDWRNSPRRVGGVMYRFPSKDMPAYAEAIRVSGGKPMRLRLPRLAFACGLALLTYGCRGVEVINCLPADPGLQLPAGSNIDPAPPAFVDLYLDASTSMLGFLPEEVNATPHQVSKQKQPRMEAQITYETVLDAIRRFTQESSPDPSKDRRVFAFGGSVCDITTQDYGLWLKSAFYKSSPSRNCDNALSSRTELGRVLEKIKTEQLSFSESPKEGHLSVIVTDLFFARGLGIAAISQVLSPIDAMLKSGLAFAVLG